MNIPIPGVESVPGEAGSGVEAERLRCVGRERTLKAVAALLLIWNTSCALKILIASFCDYAGLLPSEFEAEAPTAVAFSWFAWSLGLVWAAWQLWSLRSWGRLALIGLIPGFALTLYGYFTAEPLDAEETGMPTFDFSQVLFVFFVGVSAYLIWLGFAKKTRRVLSASYQHEVVAQTPRIENRLAGTTKVALIIMALFSSVGVVLTAAMLLGWYSL